MPSRIRIRRPVHARTHTIARESGPRRSRNYALDASEETNLFRTADARFDVRWLGVLAVSRTRFYVEAGGGSLHTPSPSPLLSSYSRLVLNAIILLLCRSLCLPAALGNLIPIITRVTAFLASREKPGRIRGCMKLKESE